MLSDPYNIETFFANSNEAQNFTILFSAERLSSLGDIHYVIQSRQDLGLGSSLFMLGEDDQNLR